MAEILLDGARRRLEREQNERVSLAWMTASLSRATRLPRLQSLLSQPARRRQQTWQEQLATVRMINAAFGGK